MTISRNKVSGDARGQVSDAADGKAQQVAGKEAYSDSGAPLLSALTKAVHSSVQGNAEIGDEAPRDYFDGGANLLVEANLHWNMGEWQWFADLPLKHIANQRGRESLVLLAATAHFQLGSEATAREYLQYAIDWGCQQSLIQDYLVRGAHVSVAQAWLASGDRHQAKAHLMAALAPGLSRAGSDAIAEARLLKEVRRGTKPGAQEPPSPKRRPSHSMETNSHSKSGVIGQTVIAVAGMRHSGSTALFNIIRIALETTGKAVNPFYIEHKGSAAKLSSFEGISLVKLHEYRDDVAFLAGLTLTTRRDLRDSVASAARRDFPLLKKLGGVTHYAKYNRSLHDQWRLKSDYEFVYERFMAEPEGVISEVLDLLGVNDVSPRFISKEVGALPKDKYEVTLLSPQHITDPERVLNFKDTLSAYEIECIECENFDWLGRFDYDTLQ